MQNPIVGLPLRATSWPHHRRSRIALLVRMKDFSSSSKVGEPQRQGVAGRAPKLLIAKESVCTAPGRAFQQRQPPRVLICKHIKP